MHAQTFHSISIIHGLREHITGIAREARAFYIIFDAIPCLCGKKAHTHILNGGIKEKIQTIGVYLNVWELRKKAIPTHGKPAREAASILA
jgi:hypothetical protein